MVLQLEKLSELGQELQIDFTVKIHNENLNGEPQILIAIDRFSKWPFLFYGVPEKIKSDKRGGGVHCNRIQRIL